MTAKALLNLLISVYVDGCNVGQPHTDRRTGQAEMLIRAAMIVYDLSHDHATEFVADRVSDILVSRD